jgi:hypothetical protein
VVGERLMQALNRADWTVVGQTAAGALCLAVLGVIPFFGGLLTFVSTAVGVGAVVLTRFGTQPYPAPVATSLAPVTAAPAPVSEPFDPQI